MLWKILDHKYNTNDNLKTILNKFNTEPAVTVRTGCPMMIC